MKTLIISGAYPSKKNPVPSIFTHNQAKALRKQNIDTIVLVVDMRSIRRIRKWGFYQENYEDMTVYRIAVPCGPIPRLLPFLAEKAMMYSFKKVIKLFGYPDIIHAHCGMTASWAVPLKNKYDIPFIVTEHSSKVLNENRDKKTGVYSKKAYDSSDALICVSKVLQRSMSNLTDKNIIIIPNVLPSHFRYKNIRKGDTFNFISVGRFTAGKRFDITITAFSKIHSIYPNTRLIIVGDGNLKNRLIEIVNENNIANIVEFLGVLPNDKLPEIYNACHCFILPSMFETFGVVYAEALACGLPVIATKCGGPEDFINDGNGLLIPLNSLDAAVNAMEYMYNNFRKYDSEDISRKIISTLNEEHIGRNLIKIYNNAILKKK